MIKAIETVYNGYKFRSRLEARWAVFFDALGIKYEYEKEGYEKDGICYLPDFALPNMYLRGKKFKNIFVEIKPKAHELTEDESKKIAVAIDEDNALILFCGPPEIIYEMGGEQYEWIKGSDVEYPGHDKDIPDHLWWDNYMILCKCYECGTFKFEFMESNYMYCPICSKQCDEDHPDIQKAVLKAKQAQFEFNG